MNSNCQEKVAAARLSGGLFISGGGGATGTFTMEADEAPDSVPTGENPSSCSLPTFQREQKQTRESAPAAILDDPIKDGVPFPANRILAAALAAARFDFMSADDSIQFHANS